MELLEQTFLMTKVSVMESPSEREHVEGTCERTNEKINGDSCTNARYGVT
jgi:hypothetical protein